MARLSERELDLRAQADAIEKALSVPGTFEALAEEVNRLRGSMEDKDRIGGDLVEQIRLAELRLEQNRQQVRDLENQQRAIHVVINDLYKELDRRRLLDAANSSPSPEVMQGWMNTAPKSRVR